MCRYKDNIILRYSKAVLYKNNLNFKFVPAEFSTRYLGLKCWNIHWVLISSVSHSVNFQNPTIKNQYLILFWNPWKSKDLVRLVKSVLPNLHGNLGEGEV